MVSPGKKFQIGLQSSAWQSLKLNTVWMDMLAKEIPDTVRQTKAPVTSRVGGGGVYFVCYVIPDPAIKRLPEFCSPDSKAFI